ncbi:hypothetical protein ABT246_36895 [Streptomyces sp. NPDC001553]|uniref:hypothetical protein n=1 Tax=Streptomyces sp. NPDC001553 TaxID=3154385 RepID=UPI00331B4455
MSGAVPSGSGRPGAGPKRDLVFIDGLTVTLVFIDGLPVTLVPPQAEHRARARPAGRLLINTQPTRQAGTPKPRSRTKS